MIEPVQLAAIARGAPLDADLDSGGTPRRPLVAVDLRSAGDIDATQLASAALRLRGALPFTVGVGRLTGQSGPAAASVVEALTTSLWPADDPADRRGIGVPDLQAALIRLHDAAHAAPRAVVTLGRLLRQTEVLPVPDALAAESAAYSTLLGGPEFGRWLATRRPPRPPVPGGLRMDRTGDVLTLTLDRPARRNAVDAAMRDALCDGLAILAAEPDLRLELRATGPDFSFGGDLDEFGTAPDVATAHIVRLAQSAGMLLAAHGSRVTAFLHGGCHGAGLELPAFATRIVATRETQLSLPELRLGLIPGAGGTVSVTRRIGRWRTAWMWLSGERVDARAALRWGLIDQISG